MDIAVLCTRQMRSSHPDDRCVVGRCTTVGELSEIGWEGEKDPTPVSGFSLADEVRIMGAKAKEGPIMGSSAPYAFLLKIVRQGQEAE
jgi:hypothetical protein